MLRACEQRSMKCLAASLGPSVVFGERGLRSNQIGRTERSLPTTSGTNCFSKLRSTFGRTGSVAEVAGAREWDGSQGALDPIHLSARSKGGSTRVSIKSDIYGAAFVIGIVSFFPLLLVALAVTKFTNLPALTELLMSAGFFGVAAAGWRKFMGWIGLRRRSAIAETEQAIEGLVDRIANTPSIQSEEAEQLRLRT